jgi:hypothetical protein
LQIGDFLRRSAGGFGELWNWDKDPAQLLEFGELRIWARDVKNSHNRDALGDDAAENAKAGIAPGPRSMIVDWIPKI